LAAHWADIVVFSPQICAKRFGAPLSLSNQYGDAVMNRFRVFAALLVLGAPSYGVAAEPPAPMARQVTALQECRKKTEAADRLACYDKAVDDLSAATASQDVVVIERTEVRKARKGLFGFSLPRIGFLAGRDGNKEDEDDAKRFEGKIVSVREIAQGGWQFTVEGGAIWMTLETSFSFKTPAPDRMVLIERGALGSYSARVGNGGWVRVKRLQ
jgi:hypothetical protein